MIGKLLSAVTKVVTLPIDVVEIATDVVTGGDGSREELKNTVPMPSGVRDEICKVMEEIDE